MLGNSTACPNLAASYPPFATGASHHRTVHKAIHTTRSRGRPVRMVSIRHHTPTTALTRVEQGNPTLTPSFVPSHLILHSSSILIRQTRPALRRLPVRTG